MPTLKNPFGRGRTYRTFLLILTVITLVGLILRVLCCFWGYPYQLHTDEPFIVDHAFELFDHQTWEARVYYRPDQFEIKCDALLFFLFSRLKYHAGIRRTFEEHRIAFHLVARFFTVFWGTLMIPLAALFTGKLLERDDIRERYRRAAQLFAAGLTALLPVYVQHSAYATPDIPLASLTLLIACLSLYYLENGNRRVFCAIAILTGVSITIKYPAAVMCPYIAFIAIYRGVKERSFKGVLWAAGTSIGLILFTMFVIAPNLFMDFRSVIGTILHEAGPEHLGADGLGFWGNLRYYLLEMFRDVGVLSFALFLVGLVFLALHRSILHAGLVVSAIYWVCLSALSLHWQRWGTPMYIGYIALSAIGGAWLLQLARERTRVLPRRAGTALAALCVGLIGINLTSSSLALTKWTLAPAASTESIGFCEEQGITRENSIYEGYTPLQYVYDLPKWNQFHFEGDELAVNEDQASKRYLVISSTIQGWYFDEPERYPEVCAVYRAIDDTFAKIYEMRGSDYGNFAFEPANIADKVKYLFDSAKPTGGDVIIYDLWKKI